MFLNCSESETAFILGAGYKKENAKWQLLNFEVGQAKLSIYKSRKNLTWKMFHVKSCCQCLCLLVKARVRVRFQILLSRE